MFKANKTLTLILYRFHLSPDTIPEDFQEFNTQHGMDPL